LPSSLCLWIKQKQSTVTRRKYRIVKVRIFIPNRLKWHKIKALEHAKSQLDVPFWVCFEEAKKSLFCTNISAFNTFRKD
jgi:hypothetical protein